MTRQPRDPKAKLLDGRSLLKSIIQGLAIFAASFGAYFTVLAGDPVNAPVARTMGLAIIMLSNLFLVQVNSSDSDFVIQSISRLAKDSVMWAVNIGTLFMLAIILYTPISGVLKLAPLTAGQLFSSVGIAAAAVLWYEIVKLINRLRSR
jgi:Ca2+-transporting ATPase